MKISIFSGLLDQTKKQRWKSIEKAIKKASARKSKLLILPGWSLFRKVGDGVDKIQNLSDLHKINIFFDEKGYKEKGLGRAYFIRPNKVKKGPYMQTFWSSKEADKSPELVENLVRMIDSCERNVSINSINFSSLLCGENNFLKNLQSENNKVIIRHDAKFKNNSYDVLINQSHTTMGNWPKLKKRFEYLSKYNKYLIYLTNNASEGESWKSSINIYYNGERVLTGSFENDIGEYDVSEEWRMVTIKIRKQNLG